MRSTGTEGRRGRGTLLLRGFATLLLLASGRAALAAGVVTNSGIVYAQGAVRSPAPGFKNLTLDLYRPGQATNGCALVLVHGGSFVTGNSGSSDMVDAANYFAERGWTCVSINYRLAGDNPPAPVWIDLLGQPQLNATHAAATDTKRAIRWLRANAASYGIDTNRVAVLGHSAGAYCALMATITDEADFANDAGTAVPDFLPAVSAKVNAGVEVSGNAGISIGEMTPDDPPLMIWHGTADTTVDYSYALEIQSACNSNAVPHWLKTLPGINHGAPTWLATLDGRDVKSWAEDFLNRFFQLEIRATDAATLAWPSVRHATYRVQGAASPGASFTPGVTVQSTGETASVSWTDPFVVIEILSGQP